MCSYVYCYHCQVVIVVSIELFRRKFYKLGELLVIHLHSYFTCIYLLVTVSRHSIIVNLPTFPIIIFSRYLALTLHAYYIEICNEIGGRNRGNSSLYF